VERKPWLARAQAIAYPFYILHQTVIIVAAWVLRGVAMGPWERFFVLIGNFVLVTWALCEGVSRVDLLRPCFGMGPRRARSNQMGSRRVWRYPERASCPHRLHLPDFRCRDPAGSRTVAPRALRRIGLWSAATQLVVARNEGRPRPWIGPFLLEMTAGIAAWIALYAPAVAVSNAPSPAAGWPRFLAFNGAGFPGLQRLEKLDSCWFCGPRFIRWPAWADTRMTT